MSFRFYFLSLFISSVSCIAKVAAEENCIDVDTIELNEDFCYAMDFYLSDDLTSSTLINETSFLQGSAVTEDYGGMK